LNFLIDVSVIVVLWSDTELQRQYLLIDLPFLLLQRLDDRGDKLTLATLKVLD
jgi:hypothetical protein